MEAIKTAIESDLKISYSYKEDREAWCENVSIGTTKRKGVKVIYINTLWDFLFFDLKDIAKAVDKFTNIAFNPKNLMHKLEEAIEANIDSLEEGFEFDFRNKEEFEKINKTRLELIKSTSK